MQLSLKEERTFNFINWNHLAIMLENSKNEGTLTNHSALMEEEMYEATGFHAPSDVPLVMVALLIIVVNGYITLLISGRRDLRTPSNLILASLTISDGLTGLVTVPLVMTCTIIEANDVCISSAVFVRFISILSAVHILLLTLDRYIFIVCANKYYDLVRKNRVFLLLLGIWLMSIIVTAIRLDWAVEADVYGKENNIEKEIELNRKERIFNWFCLVTFFFIPLIITVILDAELLFVLKRQVRKILQNNLLHARQGQTMKTKNRERRAVIVYIIVVVTFVICWLPYFLYDLWQHWGSLPSSVEYLIVYIRIITSLSNPIMYTLSHRTLRRAVIVSLRRTLGLKRHRRFRGTSGGFTAQINRTDTTQM